VCAGGKNCDQEGFFGKHGGGEKAMDWGVCVCVCVWWCDGRWHRGVFSAQRL